MDRDSAIELCFELEYQIIEDILNEWYSAKGTDKKLSWRLIPSGKLIKEWNYSVKTGLCHNKIIDEFQEICIENTLKIYINTIIFGHTSTSPFGYLEAHLNEDMTEPEFEIWMEDFEWFACDDKGNWKISDYATDELNALIVDLLCEDDYNKKLAIIDMILNVVHPRSDIASWYVEGGSHTLTFLFEKEIENEKVYA